MILSTQQIHELFEIIQLNQANLIGTQLGTDYLTLSDRNRLAASGVRWKQMYKPENDNIFLAYNLGVLAQALKDSKALNKLTYLQLKQYIQLGKYIPLSPVDYRTIQAIKQQTFSDIKKFEGSIFQDINGVVGNLTQEEFIKEIIESGIRKRKTLKQIESDLNRITGDWNRNFQKIVNYQTNSAYQEGKSIYLEKEFGPDVLVYKHVQETACKHCVKAYLTNGIGSQPRIFKLSELRKNGNNIGRKVDDWLPVIPSHHINCYCTLSRKDPNVEWDKDDKDFTKVRKREKPVLKNPRKGIRISIAGKEYTV